METTVTKQTAFAVLGIEKTHVNYCIRRDEESATYSLPKKFVKVAFPRQLSEEQRRKLALRMKAMNAQKG